MTERRFQAETACPQGKALALGSRRGISAWRRTVLRAFLAPAGGVMAALVLVFAAGAQPAARARLVKVLPHYLDLQGRHSISPSLYDRDAYQAYLRRTPSARAGLRFDVQWKANTDATLLLRAELRGALEGKTTTTILEMPVSRRAWSSWSKLALQDQAYRQFGEMIAWRVSLWDGGTLLSEQKSFLW